MQSVMKKNKESRPPGLTLQFRVRHPGNNPESSPVCCLESTTDSSRHLRTHKVRDVFRDARQTQDETQKVAEDERGVRSVFYFARIHL